MTEFLANLFNALLLVTVELENISFQINQTVISLLDLIEYSCIVTIVVKLIRNASSDGLFTLRTKNTGNTSGGTSESGN